MAKKAFLLAALLALALLWGCKGEEPQYRTFESAKGGIRFNPAKGWAVEEKAAEGCVYSVEASKGPDLRFVVCVSPPRPELLLTGNTFVSCENIKEYVTRELKGISPACNRGGSGTLFGFDALYARRVRAGDRVRIQFVDHLFIPVRGKLIQVMSMAVADDDKAAQALFDENRYAFFAMSGSVRSF